MSFRARNCGVGTIKRSFKNSCTLREETYFLRLVREWRFNGFRPVQRERSQSFGHESVSYFLPANASIPAVPAMLVVALLAS